MKKVFRLLLLASLGGLTACASFQSTPYQPATNGGYGYTDRPLGNGRYRICVEGNAATSPQTVLDQLLYRGSALALANGRSGFRLDAQGGVSLRPAYFAPAALGVIVENRVYHARDVALNVDPPVARSPIIPPLTEPSPQFVAEAIVKLEDVRDADGRQTFSARAVQTRLRERINPPADVEE